MTKIDKYKAMPTLGYWSALNGVEVKEFHLGSDEKVTVIANAWGGQKSVHTVKVNYNKAGEAYIIVCRTTPYLRDCIRN